MRDYNVALHHPHPPGFPAYIGIAHVARFFTDSDFHPRQIVNLVVAMLVFPAVYLLARELFACHPERSEGPGWAGREERASQPHPPRSLAHARDDNFTTSI